jgi:hypothetical protein
MSKLHSVSNFAVRNRGAIARVVVTYVVVTVAANLIEDKFFANN